MLAPLSLFLCGGEVISAYRHDGSPDAYWLYAIPPSLLLVHMSLLFSGMGKFK